MLTGLKALFGRSERGFTLIELLIVVLIVGILAAVATPLYLGYVQDAKAAEGKGVAGALWTSFQAMALGDCGNDVAITSAYPRAGFDPDGLSADKRWKAESVGTLKINCTTGAYDDGDKFTLQGKKSDITGIWIKLNYTVASTPPSQLLCAFDGTDPKTKC